jgi:hypothetical protein
MITSNRNFVALISLFLLLCSSISAPLAKAQNSASGTLTGLILDDTGQPLPQTIVTIINKENGNTASSRTDASGTYRFVFKPAGLYKVVAEKDGYINSSIESFVVQLNKTNVIKLPDITLRRVPVVNPTQPSTTTTPDSKESVPESLINLSDASRGGNFSQREFEALPIGGATTMRSFDEYAFLLPGVAPAPYTPGVRGPGIGFGIGTAGQFAVNGLRARSNNFTVDGSDNNDPDVGVRRQGFVALVPQAIESIQDFHISTQLWDSEQGRNVGSLVNAVSKDGGNKVHGQVYGFLTDSALNARNFFNHTGFADEDDFQKWQFGAVIGAPIQKDRTHIFASFERLSIDQSVEQHFATPGSAERRLLNLKRLGVFQPLANSLPNQFISRRGGRTAIGTNILSLYPEPNNAGGPFGDNTFTQELPADGDGSIASLKLNHQFSTGRTLNARYNYTDDNRIIPTVNRAINSTIEADTRTQNLSLIYDSQYSDRLSSQARFSYGRTRLDLNLFGGTQPTFSAHSNETVNTGGSSSFSAISQTGELGELIIEPFSPVGVNANIFPQNRVNNTFQYADSLSWNVGNHALKFGADVRRVQLNSRTDRNYRSQVVYGSALLTTGTLTEFVNFEPRFTPEKTFPISGAQLAAIGIPSSILLTITKDPPDSTIGLRFTETNLFFNDSWRVKSNFKLDYGVRYEYNTVPKEVNNRIEDAIALENLPATGNSPANTAARINTFNDSVAAYRKVLDGRSGIYEPDRNNVAFHLGFAWNPDGEGKMVIRGGYGIYYDAILGAVVSQSRNVFPNEIPSNVTSFARFDIFTLNNPAFFALRGANFPDIPLIKNGTTNQFGGRPEDFVALIGELFRQSSRGTKDQSGFKLAFTLPEKHLRTPYAQQWNLSFEQELAGDYSLAASYLGSKGTKLTRLTTPNLGANLTPTIQMAEANKGALRTIGFPIIFTDCLLQPDGSLEADGRCSRTPNRPITELGAYQVFSNSASSIYHALQLETRKRYSQGYTFTVAYTWSHAIDDVSDVFPIGGAPILPQNSFNLRAERGNANFDVQHLFSTSFIWDLPFWRDAKSAAGRALGGWQLATILQAHQGQPFTLQIPFDANFDGNLTDRPSTTNGLTFFDGHGAQKVALAPGSQVTNFFVSGQDGFVGRNTVRGDNYYNLDLALNKSFAFSESQKLMFRAEVFNLLNRANFGLPIRTIGAPGFGSAVDTINPARLIQFSLKYGF